MAARANRPRGWRPARRAGAIGLVGLCAACASIGDPVGYSIVAQDKFDFMSCREIVNSRANVIRREQDLSGLVEKAESSFGGILVSAAAYRSELTTARAEIRAANRAMLKNGCAAPQAPEGSRRTP
jgi:hypothetical protein